MNIERTQVTKLVITGAEALDPITVILEDLGSRTHKREGEPDHISRQGKVIIECYGESWSGYWGGMGNRTVAQFITDESVEYVVGCLARGSVIDRQVFCGQTLEDAVRRIIVACRRGRESWRYECGHIDDKDEARRLYDEAENLRHFDTAEGLMHSRDASDLLTVLFGDEWHYAVSDHAFVTHPKRLYLARIVKAVQDGLSQADVGVAA